MKTVNEKKSNIYFVFPKNCNSKQLKIDEEVFQLVNKVARIELECHHSAILNELGELENGHQWLLTTQKERQPDIMFFFMDKHTIISELISLKNLNLTLIKLLDPTISLGEIQKKRTTLKKIKKFN